MLCFQATARKLTSWSAKSTGNIRDRMAISCELISRWIACFPLRRTGCGSSSRSPTLGSRLCSAPLPGSARIATLKGGDANTAFFRRQCSYRRQKNHVFSLTVDGHVLTDQEEMAQAAFSHFDELLGSVDRDRPLDLA